VPKDIKDMNSDDVISTETFCWAFDIENLFLREQTISALEDQADKLGIKTKFGKLLTAFKAERKRFETENKPKPNYPDKEEPDDGQPNKAKWHEYNKDGTPINVMDAKLVDYIITNYHLFVISKMPYIYENGVYRIDDTETRLKAIIQELIHERLITINVVNRIYGLIISNDRLQRYYEDLNNIPRHWINFKNCYFDVIEWEEIEHDPRYLTINQIPHEFQKDAESTGEVTENFLEFAVPDKADREVIWQYFGYSMTTDCSLQKFLILKGQGGTGKSLLIKIIETIVGRENSSSISLQQLNEKFYPYMLLGKLLNACADIPSKAMEAVDGIKKATGEDSLFAEKKGKDGFSFNSYAKLIFSANEIPINIEEKSEALYRRMMIIKMENKPEKKDPYLWSKLKKEIDYDIMAACKALKRMYENGKITESQNVLDNVTEVHMEADNVMAFLGERTKKLIGKSTTTSDLFEEYEKYCKDNGRNPMGSHGFHRNMKNKGYIKKKTSMSWKYEDIVILDETETAENEGFVTIDEADREKLPWEV
jgi:P4 family phage/plasmid primase-like protien